MKGTFNRNIAMAVQNKKEFIIYRPGLCQNCAKRRR